MIRTLTAAALLLAASPALAQSGGEAEMPDPNDRSNTLTIAVGAAAIADYEGSDDYKLSPAAGIRGRVGGMNFWSSGTWLYLDVLGRPDSGLDIDAGPIVGVRRNRNSKVDDAFVDRLPERDMAVEVGGFAGVSMHGLTNPYDALSFRLDVLKDVGGAHKSTIFAPSVSFGTPLSRTFYVSASAGAEWAGGGYADYYYSISPAESLASGLPAYDADGGMKQWNLGALANASLTGDLTHGLSVFSTLGYSRLTGDFADSPIVTLRGSRNQWMAAVGLAYTF